MLHRKIGDETYRVIHDAGWYKVRIIAADGVSARFAETATGRHRHWKWFEDAKAYVSDLPQPAPVTATDSPEFDGGTCDHAHYAGEGRHECPDCGGRL